MEVVEVTLTEDAPGDAGPEQTGGELRASVSFQETQQHHPCGRGGVTAGIRGYRRPGPGLRRTGDTRTCSGLLELLRVPSSL